MKATLMCATLALVLGTPAAFSKSEVESLRDLCSAQKQQIQKLSDENARLKGSKETTKIDSKTISDTDDKSKTGTYKVRGGDTLERIARKLNCSPSSLGKANGIKPETVIHPGLVLKVPGAAKSDSPAADRTVSKPTSRKSDKIASNKDVKSDKSEKPEKTSKPDKSEAKAEAKSAPSKPIASTNSSETRTISNPKPAAPAPQPEATAAAEKAPVAGGGAKPVIRSVIIQDVTSFGDFATSHGTTADRLNDLNGLSLSTSTVLAKGSELYIPAQP